MPLQFDIDIAAAELFAELLNGSYGAFDSAALPERVGQRTLITASEANQAGCAAGNFFGQNMSLAFFGAEFHARDQPAKILVSGAGFDQDRIAPSVNGSKFRANMSLNRYFLSGQIKTGRSVNAVAVQQGQSPHSALGAFAGQIFRRTSAFQKAERGARMQFGVYQ